MALTQTPIGKPTDYGIVLQTAVGLTADKNARNGTCKLYGVLVDNSVSGASANYLKIFDHDGDGLVEGTTLPDLIIPIEAEVVDEMQVFGTSGSGLPLDSESSPKGGLSFFAAQEDGNDATTAPAQNMEVRFITD